MKTLFLAVLVVFSMVAARGAVPEKTVDGLLQKVRAELPKGWTAAYDAKIPWVEVSREREVLAKSALPNGPANEEPKLRKYAFAFRVVPAVSPVDYRRWHAENAKIQEQVDVLYEELTKMHMTQKFDSFSPGTAPEKEAVARYEALKKTLHALPDFYFEDIGLTWAFGGPDWSELLVEDKQARTECKGVRAKVVKVLSKYAGN